MSVEGGRLFAVPFHVTEDRPEKATLVLDWLTEHPLWFAMPMSPEEIRAHVAWQVVQPHNKLWEIYDGGSFVGLIVLSDLKPGADAVFHFTMFPGTSLFAARKLLDSFLGYAFETFNLQRITCEVPEDTRGLLAFLRGRLGFRFEGELSCSEHRICAFLGSKAAKKQGLMNQEPAVWVAKQGSRRERAHWDGRQFRDLLLLRLLKSEYHKRVLPADEAGALREREESSLELGREAGNLRAVHPSGLTGA